MFVILFQKHVAVFLAIIDFFWLDNLDFDMAMIFDMSSVIYKIHFSSYLLSFSNFICSID